jgi:hypothetical protein
VNSRAIKVPRSTGQKILIQRKKKRIPARLTRTWTLIGMVDLYHTPHSVRNFFLSSLTIGSWVKKKFPQTRRYPHYVGSPVLQEDVKIALKQGVLVLLLLLVTIQRLSRSLPVNTSSFPSLRMAGLAD